MSMIFISGIISIITHKNMLCTNKIHVIYFCPNCVNVLPENVHFGGTDCLLPQPACAPMVIGHFATNLSSVICISSRQSQKLLKIFPKISR